MKLVVTIGGMALCCASVVASQLLFKVCVASFIIVLPRVHNSKCMQLPYCFYTRHLDGMT